ncbi:MAG: hypothetical protein CSB21_01835 [Deltaproteobacteria bacterium]|nr:MAG: hypothetical protein CSB21_01835 [Deltaproteobacteria bacterium]
MRKLFKNPHFLMLLYSILVAGSFTVGHLITSYMDSILLIFTRFFLASIIFGFYIIIKYKPKWPSLKDSARYFAISSTLVLYFWGMFESLKYTTPIKTGIIYTLVPMFSTCYGYFLLKEKPSCLKIMVLFFAMTGAIWVISDGSILKLLNLDFGKGDILFLLACMSMGLFSPFSKLFSGEEETPVMTFWTLVTGTIILFFPAFNEIIRYQWLLFPVKLAAGLLYLVIFPTIITFFIVQYSSQKMEVSKVMSYIYMIPVFVVFIQMVTIKVLPEPVILPGIIISGICTFLFQKIN